MSCLEELNPHPFQAHDASLGFANGGAEVGPSPQPPRYSSFQAYHAVKGKLLPKKPVQSQQALHLQTVRGPHRLLILGGFYVTSKLNTPKP